MGLTATLGNALSGMNTNQRALTILSRNVSNAGTPGYHRQSLDVVDRNGGNSPFAQPTGVNRAFNQSLQAYYTRQVSNTSDANIQASYLDRLQTYLGKPGDPGSLDTVFNTFKTSLQDVATSPDDYAARAKFLSDAQGMVETLNRLTGAVQGLRQETEAQISGRVDELNGMLATLQNVNSSLGDQGTDPESRATLMDQRDRLVSSIAEIIDVKADYRSDGSVALMTRAGVGLLDKKASFFSFEPAGNLSAGSTFSLDPSQSGVGKLTLTTPSGLQLDLVGQGVLQSGELAGLVKLRDETLVTAQGQLDDIAAGLAQAMSTVLTPGTAATSGAATGFTLDLANIQKGNDFVLNYTEGGVAKTVKVVRVDDTTKLPMDFTDANGTRVIGLDFSGGVGPVAAALQTALGSGLAVTNPSGTTIQILDDGAAATTDIAALTGRSTVTGLQTGDDALSLFTDTGNVAFTNSLDGLYPQKQGFAGRISINTAVQVNNKLLVQADAGGSLGDATRPNLMLDQLNTLRFTSGGASDGSFRLNGSVGQIISQAVNYQGSTIASALDTADNQALTLETVNGQLDNEYGVDIDEEMARLMELQNAYAANARVVSIVQELLDALMNV